VKRADVPAPSHDLKRAAWGGAMKMAGAVATGLSGFAIALMLTRILGTEAYGLYSLGLVTAEIATQVAELGLRSSALRFTPVAHRYGDVGRLQGLFRVVCGFPLAFGVVIALLVLLTADLISVRVFDDERLAPVLRAFAFAIPLSALSHSLEAMLRGLHRADLSILGLDLGFQIPRLLLTTMAVFLGAEIVGAAWSHVLALAVAAVLLRFLLRPFLRSGSVQTVPDYRQREIWHQALPMYLTRMLQAFGGRLETLVLGVVGLTSSVGIFAAALQLTRVPEVFRRSLAGVTMPLVSDAFDRGGRDEFRPLVHAVSRWSTMVTLPFFVIAVLFAEPVLSMFGEEFRAGSLGLVVLSGIPLLDALVGLCTAVLAMTGNARLNTVNSFTFLVAKIALDIMLIPTWGVTGAAVAAFAAMAILSALRVAETYWLFRIWPVDRSILRVLMAAALSGSVGLSVKLGSSGMGELPTVLLGIGGVASIYGTCLLTFGLAEEDRILIDRARKKLPGPLRRRRDR